MRKKPIFTFVLGLALGVGGSWFYFAYSNAWWPFGGDTGLPGPRPPGWAQPIENVSVRNLHKVSGSLYRGAQPDEDGMRGLERLGIKTVVNLRLGHSDRDELAGTSLAYEHIAAEPWDMDDDEVVRFLKIATDPARAPVFVHCAHGADRTGAMVAIYRIVVQRRRDRRDDPRRVRLSCGVLQPGRLYPRDGRGEAERKCQRFTGDAVGGVNVVMSVLALRARAVIIGI